MPPAPGNGNRGPLLFHSLNEICLIAANVSGDTGAARYQSIVDSANQTIARFRQFAHERKLPGSDRARHELLMKDLQPTEAFWKLLDDYPDALLRPLSPTEDERIRGVPDPWIELPPVRQDATEPRIGMYICQVGDAIAFRQGAAAPSDAQALEREQQIRELIKAFYLHPPEGVAAATPNWFGTTAQGDCPSPAAVPQPVPPLAQAQEQGRFRFRFANGQLDDLIRRQRARETPSGVVVAIIDTCPEVAAVTAAAGLNPLLGDVATNVTIDAAPLSRPLAAFTGIEGIVQNVRNRLIDQATGNPVDHFDFQLRMDDHGLFAAGIVCDIAPKADIHLIRGLNGYGVTDLRRVLPVIQAVGEADWGGRRLVINLSLGFSIPPGVAELKEWLQSTFTALESHLSRHPDLETAIDELDDATLKGDLIDLLASLKRAQTEMFDWLRRHPRILVIAAAGNDNDYFPSGTTLNRPEPRWPARYDSVLGVAAVNRDNAPAHYSNRGDAKVIGNGVATWGGEATRPATAGPDLSVIKTSENGVNLQPDQVDAIKGIYSSENLVLNGGRNDNGWVYWAGTSFAAPIISAVAASVWAEILDDPDYAPTPAEMDREPARIKDIVVQHLADLREEESNVNRLNCPILRAYQEWTVESAAPVTE